MTEQNLYIHTNYIWQRVLLRVIVMSPFAITVEVANFISNKVDKICQKLDKILPAHYNLIRVPFDQLSKREQKAIQRVRGTILSQVQDSF